MVNEQKITNTQMENTTKKDPAFLFYPEAFVNGTTFMSHEQIGIYIILLANQHIHGHLSEKQILRLVGVLDEEVMAKFTTDSEGKWYNVKLDEEIARRKAYGSRQKELANKRWKKDTNVDATADAMAHATDMPALKTKTRTRTKASTIESKSPNPNFIDPLADLYSDLSLEELTTTNIQTLNQIN